jgi:BMFP domain-containing protein YqiC
MSKNSDFLSTLKSFANNVHLGDKSATDVADSVNAWLKEGGEALKVKIEDEVERSVSKMGFVKRGEFEALKQEVASLKKGTTRVSPEKKSGKKTTTKKTTAKKVSAKKTVKKSAKKAAGKKVAQ